MCLKMLGMVVKIIKWPIWAQKKLFTIFLSRFGFLVQFYILPNFIRIGIVGKRWLTFCWQTMANFWPLSLFSEEKFYSGERSQLTVRFGDKFGCTALLNSEPDYLFLITRLWCSAYHVWTWCKWASVRTNGFIYTNR